VLTRHRHDQVAPLLLQLNEGQSVIFKLREHAVAPPIWFETIIIERGFSIYIHAATFIDFRKPGSWAL
jgi:hypothetical protein